ncbi:MAG: hypothetical protein JXQ90_22580 [Cyclobacteriaceae bacterium]
MNRVITTILILSSVLVSAQDRLTYLNGFSREVKVVEIDSNVMYLKYVIEGEEYVVGLSTLESLDLKSTPEIVPRTNSDPLWFDYRPIDFRSRTSLLRKPAKFQYGKWSIGTSPFLKAVNLDFWELLYPTNPSPTLFIEYFMSDKFGVNISYRHGFANQQLDMEPVDDLWDFQRNNKEMNYQVTVFPKFYPFGQSKFSFYFGPIVNFGSKADFIGYSYSQFSIDPNTGIRERWEGQEMFVSSEDRSYFEAGGMVGLTFNLHQFFCFSVQTGVWSSSTNRFETFNYSNHRRTEVDDFFLEWHENSNRNDARGSIQLILTYRFGGKEVIP